MGKQERIVMGAVIAAISITLATVAFLPALTSTAAVSTALADYGHVTLTIYDPNGDLIGYRQGDNFLTNLAVNQLQQLLFVTGTSTFGQVQWLALCQGDSAGGTATVRTDTACGGANELSVTRQDGTAGQDASTSSKIGDAAGTTEDVLSATLTLTTIDNKQSFNELAAFDTQTLGGNMYSTATFAEIFGVTGLKVEATYTHNINGN